MIYNIHIIFDTYTISEPMRYYLDPYVLKTLNIIIYYLIKH